MAKLDILEQLSRWKAQSIELSNDKNILCLKPKGWMPTQNDCEKVRDLLKEALDSLNISKDERETFFIVLGADIDLETHRFKDIEQLLGLSFMTNGWTPPENHPWRDERNAKVT